MASLTCECLCACFVFDLWSSPLFSPTLECVCACLIFDSSCLVRSDDFSERSGTPVGRGCGHCVWREKTYHIIQYLTTQGEGNPPMCYQRGPGEKKKQRLKKRFFQKQGYDVTLRFSQLIIYKGESVTSLLEIENPRWQIGLVPQNPVTAKRSFVTGPFFCCQGQ